MIPVLDGPGYLQKVLDYRDATGQTADPDKVADYLTPEEVKNLKVGHVVNWVDSVVKTGIINNYHLDVSGKTKNTNYYLAGTYFKNQGITRNDNFKRTTLNLNLTNNITDWYSITARSKFSFQDRSGLPASLLEAFRASPYGTYYDENGPGGFKLYPVGDPLGKHPMEPTTIPDRDVRTTLWGLLSSNLNVPFIPGLDWTLNYSVDLLEDEHDQFSSNKTSAGTTPNGIGTKALSKEINWTLDNIIHYRRTFNNTHSLYVTLLYSLEGLSYRSSDLKGTDFFTQILGYNDLGIATIQNVSSDYEDQHSLSLMGRIDYSYKSKYSITLTGRRDGFSGFAKEHKYALFPSIAVAWTISNEQFFRNVSWLSFLKLRIAYGKNGNRGIKRYESLPRMSSDKYVFGQESLTTIYESALGNDNLTWETTIAKNLGLDFSFLNNKITGGVDIYSSETKNLLLYRALPEVSGFLQTLTNIGEVHNAGVGLSLNSTNLTNKNFTWETGFVFSLNRNRIDHLTGEKGADGKEKDDIRDGWFIGESINSIFGYKMGGIYQLSDKEEGKIPSGFRPGDFRVVDVNHDGKLDPEDRMILGNTLPSFSFSISNTFKYRNFNLYFLIRSLQGGGKKNYYVGNNIQYFSVNDIQSITYSSRFNFQNVPYWTPERPSNKYPRIDYSSVFSNPIVLQDRSFVRIQDVSLSYKFDNAAIWNEIKIQDLKLYLSIKNLYTWTKWEGYDPENATTFGDFPFMKTYTIGIKFSF